ncbi:MAG: YybH family protein [Gammaproteobacteria bacterium]
MNDDDIGSITVAGGVAAIRAFFRRLSRCCATGDFDAAQALFAPDVVSFGTKARVVEGLGPLREKQWEQIWPNIEAFEILVDEVRASAEGDLAWGMAPWTSTGFDATGTSYERPGRATAVLARREGTWLCVHTHFSLAPGTPQQSYARVHDRAKRT